MIGSKSIIQGRGTASFMLPNGTTLNVVDALYAPKSPRTLLSFKDIRANGFHLDTYVENWEEYLCVTSEKAGKRRILEKMKSLGNGLYLTSIRIFE